MKYIFGFLFLLSFTITLHAQTLQWARSFGGTHNDNCNDFAIDHKGNIVSIGSFIATVDFDPGPATTTLTSAGANDIFFCKTDSTGNFQWVKGIGSANIQEGIAIDVDTSNNIYITGRFRDTVDFDPGPGICKLSSSATHTNVFICKYDENGNFIWAIQLGAINNDVGNDIKINQDGNLYVIGNFYNTVDFNPDSSTVFNLTSSGGTDIFVLKLSLTGKLIWAKKIGGPQDDVVSRMVCDSIGNIHLTGNFIGTTDFDAGPGIFNLSSVNNSYTDLFITKWDSTGGFKWAKKIAGSEDESGNSISVDRKGNVYVTGSFSIGASAGLLNLVGIGGRDILLSKQDSSGNFIWVMAIGGMGLNDAGAIVLTDRFDNIYLSGIFEGTVDFDPGPGIYNLTGPGFVDPFLLKLDPLGSFVWAGVFGGAGVDVPSSMYVDSIGRIFMCGRFESIADLDPGGTSNYYLTSAGAYDAFILKINQSSSATNIFTLQGNPVISISPNPFIKKTSIQAESIIESVALFDTMGRKVFYSKINSKNAEIDLTELPRGVYFMNFQFEKRTRVRKIIKH